MTQKIWFKCNNQSYVAYDIDYLNPLPLINLGVFLDINIRPRDNINWINDPMSEGIWGIESDCSIEGNNVIVTIDYLDDIPPFITTRDLFYRIVQKWQEIYPLFPSRIGLIQEDNKFTFEYETEEGHQKIVIE